MPRMTDLEKKQRADRYAARYNNEFNDVLNDEIPSRKGPHTRPRASGPYDYNEDKLLEMGGCILSGAIFGAKCDDSDGTLLTRRDLNSVVKKADLVVANSENTMAVGAHGRPLLAVKCKKRSCIVFYQGRDGKCHSRDGTPREVLTHELRGVLKRVWNQEID